MSEQDDVRVSTGTETRSDGRSFATALITVSPGGDRAKPDLDFLHVGDEFEDSSGRGWRIVRARQVETSGRTHDDPFHVLYSWRYEAVDADFEG